MTAAGATAGADAVLDWLHVQADPAQRAELGRYGISDERALGIPMKALKAKGKAIGRDQGLARALWATGLYEGRILAGFVADPGALAPEEADAWAAEFDSWALCDSVCFHLFDRTPFAWERVPVWAADERLYVRRAAFATLWGLTVHHKTAPDSAFEAMRPIFVGASRDERTHVKKAVDMALRAVGKRNRALNAAARDIAAELAAAADPTARWIGTHAGRELASEQVQSKLARTGAGWHRHAARG